MILRLTLLLLSGLLLALPVRAAPTLAELNQRVVDDHLIPRYQQLATASAALADSAKALCTRPDEEHIAAARQAYQGAMDAWQGISHLRFGPVELLLRYHRFQLWPDKRNTGGRQLGQMLAGADPTVLEAERFAQASVAVQGFSALERLWFGSEPVDGYRCALSRAIADNLATMSGEIVGEWTGGQAPYRQQMLQPGGSDAAFESHLAVSSQLLNNLDTQLQAILEQKLGRPLDAGRLRPKRGESWRSGRSLRNIALNLAALRELYLTGFAPLLADDPAKKSLDRRVRAAFAAAETAAAIERPLAELAGDPAGRAALDGLQSRMRVLKGLVGGELPQALDIPLGFNSLDGD